MRRFHAILQAHSWWRKRLVLPHGQITLPYFNHSVTLSRLISYNVTAANFSQEVLQSQQAICLIYYINTRGCTAYLQLAEKLVDELNALTSQNISTPCANTDTMRKEVKEKESNSKESSCNEEVEMVESSGTTNVSIPDNKSENQTLHKSDAVTSAHINTDTVSCSSSCNSSQANVDNKVAANNNSSINTKKTKVNVWLKLCTINADENRNLASTFSVERAKLPVTYFIMQSTIIDRVVGQISENRLQNILHKFFEHYQKELNVDLLSKRNRESLRSENGTTSPLPRATSVDLISDTSTQFLQNKIMAALVGSEMIRLPEEIGEIEGLKKTIQQAKQKASKELREHQQSLGMNLRKLREKELQEKYYKSLPFVTFAIISALETLFLARIYASVGNIDRKQVEWAHTSLLNDFSAVMSNTTMRRVVALIEANLLKGDVLIARTRIQKASKYKYEQPEEEEEEEQHLEQQEKLESPVSTLTGTQCKETNEKYLIEKDEQYCTLLLNVIDEHIDTRMYTNTFPSALVEELFTKLKAEMKAARLEVRNHTSNNDGDRSINIGDKNTLTTNNTTSYCEDSKNKKNECEVADAHISCKQRVKQIQTVIMCILQLYSADPASQTMRSKLSSLLY